jgi:hypothetical protein
VTHALDQLLTGDERHATFQDAIVLGIQTDYAQRRFVADLELLIGDPDAADSERRRLRRRGQLVVENLRLWALEAPDRTPRPSRGLLLTDWKSITTKVRRGDGRDAGYFDGDGAGATRRPSTSLA